MPTNGVTPELRRDTKHVAQPAPWGIVHEADFARCSRPGFGTAG